MTANASGRRDVLVALGSVVLCQAAFAQRRGAHATVGRPVWPSKSDKRALPAGASIAGEHAFSGQGVPESFKFTIPAAQDVVRQFP